MAQGILVKVWNVKDGSQGRSGFDQITDSINYITNEEKCKEVLADTFGQLDRELHYVMNDVKTVEGIYIGGRHILDLKHASDEFMQVKEYFGKTGGRVALHGIISLDIAESDKKNAANLMLLLNDLLEEIFPEHQAVYAVHTNTDNLHIHFILNTVGLDGRKIHMDKNFVKQVLQPAANRLALKYGFTPNAKWRTYYETDEMTYVDRKIMLRKAIDLAIEKSEDFDEFVSYLRKEGFTVNVGKYLSLWCNGMPKAMRTGKLGDSYTLDAIVGRILTKRDAFHVESMGNVVASVGFHPQMSVNPIPMKKYKDMSEDEKKEAIKLLRMGKNPWSIRYETNWQMVNTAKRFNEEMQSHELLYTYSKSGSLKEALDEIVKRQKLLAEDKKAIKANLKAYKPVIDLYRRMKQIEVRAYLYDLCGCMEYEEEYKEYKELEERIFVAFGKTVHDVAEFIAMEENALLYGQAQSNELSEHYRILKRNFTIQAIERGEAIDISLRDAVGHVRATEEARDYHVFATDIRYVVSGEADKVYLKVVTTPAVVDGKNVVSTEVTVLDLSGNVLKVIDSKELSPKEFNAQVDELKSTYGFGKCVAYKDEKKAKEFMEAPTERRRVR